MIEKGYYISAPYLNNFRTTGGEKKDYIDLRTFREYLEEHAWEWYETVAGTWIVKHNKAIAPKFWGLRIGSFGWWGDPLNVEEQTERYVCCLKDSREPKPTFAIIRIANFEYFLEDWDCTLKWN